MRVYLLSLAFTYAHAFEIHRRGFSFRPGRVDTDPVDSPSVPTYHDTPVPYAGGTTHLGDDMPGPATPEYQPASHPNQCLREECAELGGEVANLFMEHLLNQWSPSSSGTSTIRAPIVTAHATISPMPNFNVATTITLPQGDLALFDQEEQDMYYHDRLCFYANVKRAYANVASASPSTSHQELPPRVSN